MTVEEFFKMCETHDWYYAWSDDNRVWRRGEDAFDKIHAVAKSNSLFAEILQAFKDFYFRGEAWNNERGPKPVLSNYTTNQEA